MFIEIANGKDKTRLHRLTKDTSFLGSQADSDICIPDKEVSRKHLTIILENETCFVIDRGSTNGTFINDQKIEPGKKVEWPEFAHLRIGSRVLISLLKDDEVEDYNGNEITISLNDQPSQDVTRTISLAELKKVKTEELVRQKVKTKKKMSAKKRELNKRDLKQYIFIALGLMGLIAYDQIENIYSKPEDQAEVPVITRPKKIIKNDNKVKSSLLIEKKILADIFEQPKCQEPAEKQICDMILPPPGENFGVKQISSMYLNYIDATALVDEVKEILYGGEEADINKLAGILYFYRSFSAPEMSDLIGKDNLIFVFYANGELRFAMTMKPEYYKSLRESIHESHFLIAKKIGMSVFRYTDDYLTIY